MSQVTYARWSAAVAVALLFAACASHHAPPAGLLSDEEDSDGSASSPCAAAGTSDDAGPSLIAATATIFGTVTDPAGRNPLYNVSVFVPRSAVAPLSTGVSCDRCGSVAINPFASALTDESGKFTLMNVPLGTQSLVIQVGKWRKVIPINVTSSCLEVGTVALPKNGSEGDMPQIAVTTGALDALECLIRNFGVDESEFVPGPGGAGHVHLFNGFGGHGPPGTPDAQTALWNDKTLMSPYDIVALSCEGAEHNEEKTNMQAIHDYVEAGGRMFGTHFHYTWLKNSPQPDFQAVADWGPGSAPSDAGASYQVNQTFPKGASFAKWLVHTGASTSLGTIDLDDVTDSISGVNSATSQDWIDQGTSAVKYFTFNAPIAATAAAQCGRVVFSDIHVFPAGGEQWPSGCGVAKALTPQQQALEFLFFDLSACVQADSQVPTPVH